MWTEGKKAGSSVKIHGGAGHFFLEKNTCGAFPLCPCAELDMTGGP